MHFINSYLDQSVLKIPVHKKTQPAVDDIDRFIKR